MRRAAGYLLLGIILFGCNQDRIDQLEEEKAQLQAEYQLMVDQSETRDAYVEEYTSTINEVLTSLESIREREGFLEKYSSDVEEQGVDIKKQIVANIASIDEALKDSKKKLNALRQKQYASAKQAAALQATIDNLTQLVEEKEAQILALTADLRDLNFRVAEVERELEDTSMELEETTQLLNTAFYIIGTERELKEKGIIVEEGGFLGFRKTKKLADNFTDAEFTSANIGETLTIPIGSRIDNVQLISPHTQDSFHLLESGENQTELEIVDPERFWKMKYLVILTRG